MSGPGPGVQVTRRGLELTGDSVRSLDELQVDEQRQQPVPHTLPEEGVRPATSPSL